jgi:hypothetical protein
MGRTGPWLTESTGRRPSCRRSFKGRLLWQRRWGSTRRNSRWGLRGARPLVRFMCGCGRLKNAIAKCRTLHNLNSTLSGIRNSKREEEEVSQHLNFKSAPKRCMSDRQRLGRWREELGSEDWKPIAFWEEWISGVHVHLSKHCPTAQWSHRHHVGGARCLSLNWILWTSSGATTRTNKFSPACGHGFRRCHQRCLSRPPTRCDRLSGWARGDWKWRTAVHTEMP